MLKEEADDGDPVLCDRGGDRRLSHPPVVRRDCLSGGTYVRARTSANPHRHWDRPVSVRRRVPTPCIVEQETVCAVLHAYAEGRIELPPIPENARRDELRYAEAVSVRKQVRKPYTAEVLADSFAHSQVAGCTRATTR